MKKSILLFATICFALLLACASKSNDSCVENSAVSDSIPQGAIPFEYDNKRMKQIIFNVYLNDSIPVQVLWDTGAVGREIFVSDSLFNTLTDKVGEIKIGQFSTQKQRIKKIHSYFSNMVGNDVVVIDWGIFDGKIVEFSFQKHYIREVTDTTSLQKLQFMPLYRSSQLLCIPLTTIYTNGQTIEQHTHIDTGYNDEITINSERVNIPVDTIWKGQYNHVGGTAKAIVIRTDSVKIGESFFDMPKATVSLGPGRIGTKFLDKFTVILDLKNYRLYLLPLEKEDIEITK